jgi:LysM repeat protein
MKQWKRLAFFLLLNVFVSACTILAVLIAWDRLRAPLPTGVLKFNPPQAQAPQATVTPAPDSAPLPTSTPAFIFHAVVDGETFDSIAQTYGVSVDELVAANGYSRSQTLSPDELLRVPIKLFTIESVVGAGDLATEHVVLINNLDGEVSLAGWHLDNNSGSSYSFPQVSLYVKGAPLNLFTKSGIDSTNEVYWGLQAPMWQSGMQLSLRDAQGVLQATYTVP